MVFVFVFLSHCSKNLSKINNKKNANQSNFFSLIRLFFSCRQQIREKKRKERFSPIK